ncbi:hypothetical protein ACHAQA_009667 [Verticillium albo-atrum]
MTTPNEPHSRQYNHVNGTTADLLDRLAVSELCKGWPVYRDASEWMNFRSLFAADATVWTTWSGPQSIDNFIAISRAGKAAGAFIQHRECGTLVELNRPRGRALGKMKATITQRFARLDGQGPPFDVDCDCRFLFFCEAEPLPPQPAGTGDEAKPDASPAVQWKARFVKLVYEKDRVVPVDGRSAPVFPDDVLARYPEGYRYLGAAQASLGYAVDTGLATVRDQDTWGRMYGSMEKWLAGEDPELFWE